MNWKNLRKLKVSEITLVIKDKEWQAFRISLKGISTIDKLIRLRRWYRNAEDKNKAEIQIVNYINALKRGGQIKKLN